ncbi:hypothetical protein D3C71_1519160 [compost metagenome]
MNWFKKLFGIEEKMQTDIHGLPYVKSIVPMPEVKPTLNSYLTTFENCRSFNSGTTIEGLKLALKHSTKYEDRMFLSFLIKVEERNDSKTTNTNARRNH